MLKTLRSFIGTARKADATSAEIETALAGARAEITAAEQAKAEAEKAYKAGLLALEDDQADALMATMELAARNRDRAIALVEALTERLGEARAAEDQAGRRARYEAAAKAQAAAAKVLAAEYPKHARAIMGLLRGIAEADALARAVNEVLPAGLEPLPYTAEQRVRSAPDRPGGVQSEETFSAWCWPGGEQLCPEHVAQVEADEGAMQGLWKSRTQPPKPVVLRRFRRVTSSYDTPGVRAPALAATLSLPGLHARHLAFWRAGQEEHPSSIVAAIDAAAPLWGKEFGPVVQFEPTTSTRIVPLDEPAAAA